MTGPTTADHRQAEGERIGVLYVNTPTLPPLGADTWVHIQIMRALDRTRFRPIAAAVAGGPSTPTPAWTALEAVPDLELVAIDLGPELSTRGRRGRVRTALATMAIVPSTLRLARLIRRRDIRVIHTSDRPRDAMVCVLVGRLTRTPCIVHVHVGYGEWMSPILKRSLRRADVLLAISNYVAGTLVESGHEPDRIHVVLNSIDTTRWVPGVGRDEIRRELGIAHTAPVLLTVCRLFPHKGPGELIRALPAIRERHGDVRLLVAGSEMVPGYRQQLVDLAAELGVTENVVLLGQRSDVPALMAAADVYAMPSQFEPFGLVFAEAQAMTLPVVALGNGGTPEVVEDGVTGLLSEPGDIDALTHNLCALIEDPDRRRTMGARGRERVLARFAVDRMAREVEDLYRQVVGARADGPARHRAGR